MNRHFKNRELLSDVFARGLAKYVPTRILNLFNANPFVLQTDGKIGVTPMGALLAGLGYNWHNWQEGVRHVTDLFEDWETELGLDTFEQFQKIAQWDGKRYPFQKAQEWLYQREVEALLHEEAYADE